MPPAIQGLIPLIQVFELLKAIAFYRDLLGFAVVETSSVSGDLSGRDCYWAMLRRGDAALMLNTAYEESKRPSAPDPSRIAAHADTVLFFGCDNADEVYKYLLVNDWPVRVPVNTHYGMRQVYTQDPDGFELCFQHPVRKTQSVTDAVE